MPDGRSIIRLTRAEKLEEHIMGMDKKIEKKKWPAKRLISYMPAGLLILAALYGLFFRSGGSSLDVKVDRIRVSLVKEGPFREFIPIIGNVRPLNTIYLDAVEGGRVETVFLKAGSKVKKGDNILKLSNTNLLMALLNSEAQINRAGNDLRVTRLQLEQNRLNLESRRIDAEYFLKRIKRKYERNKVLYKEEFISRHLYEDNKDEYEYQLKKKKLTMEAQEKNILFQEQQLHHLEASVKQMESNLALLKEQLENLTIKAPISGHLTSLPVEVGESMEPGRRLGQIDEMDGFKVRARIDEHYINRIQLDRMGHFDLSEKTYGLKVTKVFPEVKDGKFEVDLEFTEAERPAVKRGQTLHIRLQLSEISRAVLLTRGGFYQTSGGHWVYVLNETGDVATKRKIRLGRQNPQYFEVLEGLNVGDRVITSSYENYGDMERLVLK
ncbi:MAG: efflux RND transporter periplasmic adaptor subunit [bacterium]|nr:efflux RND transporter periplasmic adaptor subunit [bacterium]